MNRSKYFQIQELVPKEVYASQGMRAWDLLDKRAIETLDWLRENIGRPITVNNWMWGGSNQLRGYRPKGCLIGAPQSAHKEGMAFDFSVDGWTDEQTKAWIEANKEGLPHRIRIEIENTNSKVHFDVRGFVGTEKIKYFNP
jgi:hypothetical protein